MNILEALSYSGRQNKPLSDMMAAREGNKCLCRGKCGDHVGPCPGMSATGSKMCKACSGAIEKKKSTKANAMPGMTVSGKKR